MSVLQRLYGEYSNILKLKGEPPVELKCMEADKFELAENLRTNTLYRNLEEGELYLFNAKTKVVFIGETKCKKE